MTLGARELQNVADDLHTLLVGGRVRKARALARSTQQVILDIRTEGQSHHLLVSGTSDTGRMQLVGEPLPPSPRQPGALVMLVRNRAVGGIIESIHADGHDRRASLRIQTLDGTCTLWLVLYGAPPGLVVVDEHQRVLGTSLPTPSVARESVDGQLRLTVSPSQAPVVRPDWPSQPEQRQQWMVSRYEAIDEARLGDELRSRLRRALSRSLASLERRVKALHRDLKNAESSDELRQSADLLSSNRHLLRRGLSEIEVTDWYVDPPQSRRIALDPALSPNANIDRLYHRARRYDRGAETVLRRLDESTALRHQLQQFLARVESDDAADHSDLSELEQTLLERRWIQAPQQPGQRKKPEERRCYHEFRATSGATILVGRGARDNDRLTFQIARGRDLWLHAADVPGSHVILRVEKDQTPTPQTVKQAALLAAHFSKARNEGVVAVHMVERKHVRKIPNGNPGQVGLAGGRGMDVRLDDPDLRWLLQQNQEASAL